MLIEEIPVVLNKFTTTDGTVFISSGPSEHQINKAKNLAYSHEENYNFLHFEIDESFLKEYKSENWNHFKWYFARNNIFCKKSWNNGVVSNSANFSVNYNNNVSEEDFLYLIRKCIITPINGQGVTFFDNCFSDDKFIDIIFFSGIIDFSELKDYSTVFFNKISKKLNISLLERLVNNNIITITLDNIEHVGNYFSYNRYHVFDSKKYNLKGTHTKAKKDESRNAEYEEFSFTSSDELEEFFKMCLRLCKIERKEILHNILYGGNWDLFLTSNYGMLSLFYQHYDNMTEIASFKKAEEIQSAVLLTIIRNGLKRFGYLTKYAKEDKELKTILKIENNA